MMKLMKRRKIQVDYFKNLNRFKQILYMTMFILYIFSLSSFWTMSFSLSTFKKSNLWQGLKMKVLVAQSCLTLCNPMDYTRQAPLSMGFSRQKWVAIPF